jgi:hypothetical protein
MSRRHDRKNRAPEKPAQSMPDMEEAFFIHQAHLNPDDFDELENPSVDQSDPLKHYSW